MLNKLFLYFLVLLFVITITGFLPSSTASAVPPLTASHASLADGSSPMYFISTGKATFQAAQDICINAGYSLASIESANENEDIVARLRRVDVEEAWTSGKQVIDQYSSAFVWDSNGSPIVFENFIQEIEEIPHFPNQTYAHVGTNLKEYSELSCSSDGDLEPTPCNVTVPECHITSNQSCTVKPGECTLTEPSCTIKRKDCTTTPGECTTETKPCTITKGTCTLPKPNCTETSDEICKVDVRNCTAVQHPCKIIPGDCIIISPSTCPPPECVTTNPPCTSTTPACNLKIGKLCSPGPITCPPSRTTCKPPKDCTEAIKVCGPPTISCPSPVVHCPEPCVTCPKPNIKCETPEPICTPPVIDCPAPKVECTAPNTTCFAPEVTCVDPVIECKEPCVECQAPEICCDNPKINCPACRPQKPCDPITPPPPTTTARPCTPCTKATTQKSCPEDNCDPCCVTVNGHKGLRHIRSTGNECIAISRDSGYKWILEDCELERHFICESKVVKDYRK